jgi:hypothetical protein
MTIVYAWLSVLPDIHLRLLMQVLRSTAVVGPYPWELGPSQTLPTRCGPAWNPKQYSKLARLGQGQAFCRTHKKGDRARQFSSRSELVSRIGDAELPALQVEKLTANDKDSK